MEEAVASLIAKGEEDLGLLFGVAVRRLRVHKIRMEYNRSAIDWLIGQSEWFGSVDPLRSLNRAWHQQVADVIEGMLLGGQLKVGERLWVGVLEDAGKPELRFEVRSPGS